MRPQSWTVRIRLTRTIPVSMSTSTSLNCTPVVPVDDSPSTHRPSTELGSVPLRLPASFHARTLDGLSFTWMRPFVATSVSGSTPSDGPTFAHNVSSALPAVERIAGDTDAAVVLPPDPPLNGYNVSPISGFTALMGRPSVSAATMATIVRVPVPRSCVPHFTTTLPSDRMSTCACVPRPPPPQRWAAQPQPF